MIDSRIRHTSTQQVSDHALDAALALLAGDGRGKARLSPAGRSRVLREARLGSLERLAAGAAGRIAPFLPRIAWAAAMGLAIVVLAVSSQFAPSAVQPVQPVQNVPNLSVVATGPRLISADYRNGEMILQWADSGRGLHVVRQATSRKALDTAPAVMVKGNRYAVVPPSSEEVLFYRVE